MFGIRTICSVIKCNSVPYVADIFAVHYLNIQIPFLALYKFQLNVIIWFKIIKYQKVPLNCVHVHRHTRRNSVCSPSVNICIKNMRYILQVYKNAEG